MFPFQQTFARLPLSSLPGQEQGTWVPAMDVYETEEAYVVRLEIAGARKQDFRLSFHEDENTLTIWGVRPDPTQEGEEQIRFLQMEIGSGEFRREVRFDLPVRREAIQARYREGLLKVVLPKR